jgi:ribonuclease P protein component
MPQRTGRFRQVQRLRRSVEFQQVIRRGRRAVGTGFVVVVAEREGVAGGLPQSRLGVTASRKVGSAVVRNRVKRRIREWFRTHQGSLGAGRDWVVIGRAAAAGLGREMTEDELSRLSQTAIRSDERQGAA